MFSLLTQCVWPLNFSCRHEASSRISFFPRFVAPEISISTTASGANVRAILDHFELASLFDLVVTGDDVAKHKPEPDAYRVAADRLGCAPEECVVIEDSDIGVAAGRAFGAPVLRVAF